VPLVLAHTQPRARLRAWHVDQTVERERRSRRCLARSLARRVRRPRAAGATKRAPQATNAAL